MKAFAIFRVPEERNEAQAWFDEHAWACAEDKGDCRKSLVAALECTVWGVRYDVLLQRGEPYNPLSCGMAADAYLEDTLDILWAVFGVRPGTIEGLRYNGKSNFAVQRWSDEDLFRAFKVEEELKPLISRGPTAKYHVGNGTELSLKCPPTRCLHCNATWIRSWIKSLTSLGTFCSYKCQELYTLRERRIKRRDQLCLVKAKRLLTEARKLCSDPNYLAARQSQKRASQRPATSSR